MAQDDWSRDFSLKDGLHKDIPDAYGAYRLRLLRKSGTPIPIMKKDRTDDEGVIYMGGENLRKRYKRMCSAYGQTFQGRGDMADGWKDVARVYPDAYVSMQFIEGADSTRLMQKHRDMFGEKVEMPDFVLRNPSHLWYRWLRAQKVPADTPNYGERNDEAEPDQDDVDKAVAASGTARGTEQSARSIAPKPHAPKTDASKTPDLLTLTEQEEQQLREAGFTLVPGADKERWLRLEQAYLASRLWTEKQPEACEFSCAKSDACNRMFRASSGRDFRRDHRGSPANYGAAGYDRLRTRDGRPVRICVTSLDSKNWTFDFRNHTRFDIEVDLGKHENSQHWRETRKLIYYALFGRWPTDSGQAAISLKLFTHVRALKCNDGVKWDRPEQMFENCLPHLISELTVLEPTIIVAQGYRKPYPFTPCTVSCAVRAMDTLCGDTGRDVSDAVLVNQEPNLRFVARVWSAPWGDALLLGLDHPRNAGDYSSALRTGFEPAVAKLMKSNYDISRL